MRAPTMTMTANAPTPSNIFPRSSSTLPNYADYNTETTSNSNTKPHAIPRASSFPSLVDHNTFPIRSEKQRSNTYTTALPPEPSSGAGQTKSNHNAADVTKERPKLERVGRSKSIVSVPKAWMQRVRGGSSPEQKSSVEKAKTQPDISVTPALPAPPSDRSRPNSLTEFARRQSWLPASRSPSPSRTIGDDSSREGDDSTAPSSISSSSVRDLSPVRSRPDGSSARSQSPGLSLLRRSTLMMRSKSPHRDSKSAPDDDGAPPTPQRPEIGSRTSQMLGEDVPATPKLFSKEKLTGLGKDPLKKKDELWSAFRALESDFQKFSLKPTGLKSSVVRITLLPFLRSHVFHAANKIVRPEDLERRVGILDKWWNGLLQLIDGGNNRYLSGGDRPIVLEAIIGIMMRPEWRLGPSDFAPMADRNVYNRLSNSSSTISLHSTASLYLVESAQQRIRATFIQNLLSQMNVVVDKMSMKSTPASLVNFCGKTAAYAFFFCPGVAEVLVKIWAVQSDTLRRVIDEYGLVRKVNRNGSIDEVVTGFPANLQSLGWTSPKALLARLHQRSTLPKEAAKIAWHGSWVTRWCGRDSDLLFVFAKHYHILVEEFLPADIELAEKARSPGFVLVQCQMLVALDTTLHRHPSGDVATGPAPATFEDVINGADASADALPLPPPSNVTRHMAENRMIMLLRDFLSENPAEYDIARRTFAVAFCKILHAAAKKTSQFDHNACFVLCDFLEEALSIYTRFQQSQPDKPDFIDWPFWLDVSRKMLQSQNSMSELRLFSLIYSSWNTICKDETRKSVVCLDWLLSRDTFQSYYLHWCPMVRAYYMRLLCWRVCRFEGEASKLDTKIYGAVSDQLKLVWANYLALKRAAKREKRTLPSTAPCLPAPGRRLLIIRMDTQAIAATIMLGLEGGASPKSTSISSRQLKNTSSAKYPPSASSEAPTDIDTKVRKRWSLMGKSLSSSNLSSSATGPGHIRQASSPPVEVLKQSAEALENARAATAASRVRSSGKLDRLSSSSSDSIPSLPTATTYRAYSFKFSLEWGSMQFSFNPALNNPKDPRQPRQPSQALTRERRLNPPRLPAPTHSWLVSQVPGTADEVLAREPRVGGLAQTKYAGRALAEWSLIVMETNNFIQRRMGEGVPDLKRVEVPVLGVEGFRKQLG